MATAWTVRGSNLEGGRFSARVHTGHGAHPASCTMGTGSFLGVKSGWSVTLTPHQLLVAWSWKDRAIPLLPLWVVRPVQSLSACTGVHFTFTFTVCGYVSSAPPSRNLEEVWPCSLQYYEYFLFNKIVSRFSVQDEFPCYIKRCIERIRENLFLPFVISFPGNSCAQTESRSVLIWMRPKINLDKKWRTHVENWYLDVSSN